MTPAVAPGTDLNPEVVHGAKHLRSAQRTPRRAATQHRGPYRGRVLDWLVRATPEEVAHAAAELVAGTARATVADRGRCTLAMSGGPSPLLMFDALGSADVPWDRVTVYQVDERIAPAGDADRNLTALAARLPDGVDLRPMPVEALDLESAAAAYARSLPDRVDLIHLGLGDDGHTASLVPGDPVLAVRDRRVAITGTYRGRRRMTLTFPVLDAAGMVLWLTLGAQKQPMLRRLRDGDLSIPASHVRARTQVVACDAAAAPT